jgi:N6-adenosine-specific RNA methylase IME4
MTFMERVAPIVDDTIAALSGVRFVEDPIAGVRYSRATSIVSSAYKRHGRILEIALRESLRDSNRHKVWHDDAFRVSREADALASTQELDACRLSTLPYGQSVRKIQIDMVAFDSADQSIRAYEIKRGNGQFDAGKIRSITRDLKCIQVLLKSYGEFCRLKPTAAESKIIFYYGIRSIPRPWSLVKDDLDEHFGFPVSKPMTTSERGCTLFSTRRKYGVIYADPPWSFRNWSAKGTGRNAVSHYDCLDFSALASLPVARLAADDCALFLWATDPLLPRAFELIQRWGFEYKTVAFYWVKLNSAARHDADYFTGLGYWTRANPEQCLLATRGKPPRRAKDVKRLVVEKRREHSRKPDCVRERIERLVGGPYLELFARETKQGWDCWGNQASLFDQGPVVTRRQPSRLIDAVELPL